MGHDSVGDYNDGIIWDWISCDGKLGCKTEESG